LIENKSDIDLLSEQAGFIVLLRGRELVVELASAACLKLLGKREVLRRSLRAEFPELEAQGFLDRVERVFDRGEAFVEANVRLRVPAGSNAAASEVLLDIVGEPLVGAGGEVVAILLRGRDAAARRREEEARKSTEAALRISEDRYRTLFASIDDGFGLIQVIVDERGVAVDYLFLETNEVFEAQTGLAGAKGRSARELAPALDMPWFALYGEVAASGRSVRFENQSPRTGRWFEVSATRVGDPALRQVALVYKDVTDRRQVALDREQHHEREQRARAEAERLNRLKDEFLATVSHELRTPLNAMLGWTLLLREGGLPESKRLRALETIERNARAQVQLIDDILDVSRIITGNVRLSVKAVDLAQAIESAVETVRLAAEAKGVTLELELQAEAGRILGDADRLQQVAWNLLSNAIKFTPSDGRVQVKLRRLESHLSLSVEDTGVGIHADFLPHIFERFRQADGAITRTQRGLGLGLAIVKHLVELHGGSIAARSGGLGQGAAFEVRLPISPLREGPIAPALLPSSRLGRDRLSCPPGLAELPVLVVDDEADARELLQSILEQCGSVVSVAASTEEAFERFASRPPAVLLCDIGMPGSDGYSLIRRIRALAPERGGHVPAVALTAYARAEDRTRALLEGFTSHITKPVEPQELLAVVAALAVRHARG
jgi:signal transduction histidine kinase/ActR/RegA family two-component response regulator